MTLVTIDQVLSGVSNILVVLVVAHLLSPTDFGLFTIVFLVYAFASVTMRALVGATVLVHPEDVDDRPRAILGAGIVISLAVGALCALAGLALLATGAEIATSLVWLGLLLPLLLVQDIGRFLAIAANRPIRALGLDGMWIVLAIVSFSVVIGQDSLTLERSVLLWAASGALSGCWVFVHWGVPRLSELNWNWLRERWDFSWRSTVTSITNQASALVGFAAIAAVSSAATVGAVRAAWLMTRPGNTVITSSTLSALGDMSRVRDDDRALRVHMRQVLWVSLAAALANLVVLVVIPDSVGRLILGHIWDLAEPLLLAAGLQLVLIAARNGTRAALLSRREIRLIMAVDIAGTILLIVLSFAGAVMADAQGVIWAGVIGQGVQTIVWWIVARHRLRQPLTTPDCVGVGSNQPTLTSVQEGKELNG